MSDNHFISVSRDGVLIARRKGYSPVEVARAEDGLEITVEREPPSRAFVELGAGGSHREVRVLGVRVGSESLTIAAFLARFDATEKDLGRWMRVAVERALDEAEARAATRP